MDPASRIKHAKFECGIWGGNFYDGIIFGGFPSIPDYQSYYPGPYDLDELYPVPPLPAELEIPEFNELTIAERTAILEARADAAEREDAEEDSSVHVFCLGVAGGVGAAVGGVVGSPAGPGGIAVGGILGAGFGAVIGHEIC